VEQQRKPYLGKPKNQKVFWLNAALKLLKRQQDDKELEAIQYI
jgi:hypothetical protein